MAFYIHRARPATCWADGKISDMEEEKRLAGLLEIRRGGDTKGKWEKREEEDEEEEEEKRKRK